MGIVEGTPDGPENTLGPVIMSASQEAEDYQRIWTAVYESVMNQTRDHHLAGPTANEACEDYFIMRQELQLEISGEKIDTEAINPLDLLRNRENTRS